MTTLPLDSLWSIEPTAGDRLRVALESASPEALRGPAVRLQPALPMSVENGVAIIDVAGVLTKQVSIIQRLFGGTSTAQITDAVRAAAMNESVKAILLNIDSPGGSADGLAECADAIFAARLVKPLHSHVDGMCCSAAFLLASQSQTITAGRMSLIGSIGTRMTVYDLSGLFSKAGIRTVSIDTGEYKSAGVPGTVLSEKQEAHLRHVVQVFQNDFIASIMRGRRMTRQSVDAVADGRVFIGDEARQVGLIDGIQSFNETLGALNGNAADHKTTFSEEMTMTTPATLAELKAACPGLPDGFYLAQLEKNATLQAAQTEAIRILQAKSGSAGVKPLAEKHLAGNGGEAEGEATAEFSAKVKEAMAGGLDRRSAVLKICRERPDLHAAFVEASNHGRRASLVEQRFGR